MHPAISTSGYSAYVYNPSPPSCTIRLMNLVCAASFTTTSGRIRSAVEMLTRRGLELVNSRPQKVLYSPATIHVSLSELAPSMTARSPRYWRMTTGAAEGPLIRSASDPDCVSGLDPPACSLQRGPQVPGPGGAAFCHGRAVWRGIVAAPCRRSVGPRSARLKQKRKQRERDHEGDLC